jgi:hypothetical protein
LHAKLTRAKQRYVRVLDDNRGALTLNAPVPLIRRVLRYGGTCEKAEHQQGSPHHVITLLAVQRCRNSGGS